MNESPNHPAGVDAGFTLLFALGYLWTGTTHHGH